MRDERLFRQEARKKRHNRQLTILISLCAALIIVSTVEIAMLANPEGYRVWLEFNPGTTPADYSAYRYCSYFVPVALALYTYSAYRVSGHR